MPRVGATLAVVPIPTMNGEGRPQADRPTCLTVGTPLPGCPDRTTKRRTGFDFPCHCEAEGRGDRRECLWCNLLLHRADLYNVPGDSYVASLLGMTGGEIVRIRRGAIVDSVRPAERSMPIPYEGIPKHRPTVTGFRTVLGETTGMQKFW